MCLSCVLFPKALLSVAFSEVYASDQPTFFFNSASGWFAKSFKRYRKNALVFPLVFGGMPIFAALT